MEEKYNSYFTLSPSGSLHVQLRTGDLDIPVAPPAGLGLAGVVGGLLPAGCAGLSSLQLVIKSAVVARIHSSVLIG